MRGVDFLHTSPFLSPDSKSKPAQKWRLARKGASIHEAPLRLKDKFVPPFGKVLAHRILIGWASPRIDHLWRVPNSSECFHGFRVADYTAEITLQWVFFSIIIIAMPMFSLDTIRVVAANITSWGIHTFVESWMHQWSCGLQIKGCQLTITKAGMDASNESLMSCIHGGCEVHRCKASRKLRSTNAVVGHHHECSQSSFLQALWYRSWY